MLLLNREDIGEVEVNIKSILIIDLREKNTIISVFPHFPAHKKICICAPLLGSSLSTPLLPLRFLAVLLEELA
jgi:hypothetical protein